MKIIEASHLYFSYEGKEVFNNISFDIREGDFLALIGPNGAGKTTLAKIIVGLLKPHKGTVKLYGQDVASFNSWGLVGYVPQKGAIGENFPGNVDEILSLKSGAKKGGIIKMLELGKLLGKKYQNLSGGEQQKVLIALSLMSGPKLLILDEPTVGVDIRTYQEFYSLLKKINSEHGVTILLITHEVGVIPSYVKGVLSISKNACCRSSPEKIDELLEEIYGKGMKIFVHAHK